MLEDLEPYRDLLLSQRFGVLSTTYDDIPHCSLVALAFSQDLKRILFATSKTTKKYNNITKNQNLSMFIDNRKNNPEDIKNTITICATGVAKVVEPFAGLPVDLKTAYEKMHPYLSGFIGEKTTVFVIINVNKYQIVSNFQEIKNIFIEYPKIV
jgi:nitroimidazol reductase NimA-like FMN-containing flavoprotein (pyridoxamine 5'-phosphate oxidase superfamily)